MSYYKWVAYDWGLKYHTGVMQENHQYKAIYKLIKRGLVPSSVEEIDQIEYKKHDSIDRKLAKLYKLKSCLESRINKHQ